MNGDWTAEPGELWRPIPEWPRYEVSDHGRIRNVQTNRVLFPHLRKGYPSVILHGDDGTERTVRIHRFVAAAFLGPSNGLPVVRHLDGDPLNNIPENLAWGTQSENLLDAVRHGRHRGANATHCAYGHSFDEKNTGIRKQGHRFCLPCQGIRTGWRQAANKAAATGAREVRMVSRDVQYVIVGPEAVRPEMLLSIDRVARELDNEQGWRIRVELDPGTSIVATPAPETPSKRPYAPVGAQNAPAQAQDAPDPAHATTGAAT